MFYHFSHQIAWQSWSKLQEAEAHVSQWLFVVWMGLKTMRIVLNEMKPSFKP